MTFLAELFFQTSQWFKFCKLAPIESKKNCKSAVITTHSIIEIALSGAIGLILASGEEMRNGY